MNFSALRIALTLSFLLPYIAGISQTRKVNTDSTNSGAFKTMIEFQNTCKTEVSKGIELRNSASGGVVETVVYANSANVQVVDSVLLRTVRVSKVTDSKVFENTSSVQVVEFRVLGNSAQGQGRVVDTVIYHKSSSGGIIDTTKPARDSTVKRVQ